MKKNLAIKNYLFGLICGSILLALIFFEYNSWIRKEKGHYESIEKKVQWEEVTKEFKECDLSQAIDEIISLAEEKTIEGQRGVFKKYIVSRLPDLRDVWIDFNVEGSIGEIRRTENSINLISQCESMAKSKNKFIYLEIGRYYLVTGRSEALKWLGLASGAGISQADILIGHAYILGLLSGIIDEKKALSFYMKAAHSGDASAQFHVGKLLANENKNFARDNIIRSANAGWLPSIYVLQDPHGFLGGTHGENTLRDRYYWNLIFLYLYKKPKKEISFFPMCMNLMAFQASR